MFEKGKCASVAQTNQKRWPVGFATRSSALFVSVVCRSLLVLAFKPPFLLKYGLLLIFVLQPSAGNPYDRVQPSVAIKLLERVRDAEKRRAGFLSAIRREERGRRKKLDDVIRQLRELNVAPYP